MSGQKEVNVVAIPTIVVAKEKILECIGVLQGLLTTPAKERPQFKIKSVDKCICLTDQKYEPKMELYLTSDEAVRIGEILVEIGRNADYGIDLMYLVN